MLVLSIFTFSLSSQDFFKNLDLDTDYLFKCFADFFMHPQ